MGALQGLDWNAARLLCAADEPWDVVSELLKACEAGAVEGAAAKAERDRPKGGGAHG